MAQKILRTLETQKRYIPLTPETVLRIIEYYMTHQLDAIQNEGNIFNKVFEASITNALNPHVTSPLTVDKVFLILGKIAFYIHENKCYPIPQQNIIDVITNYCEEYGGKIDSLSFINCVSNAHILYKLNEDGCYKFRNTNYLAYFIAYEICANRDSGAVKRCLDYICFGINQTVLLFVTYLTNEQNLINAILEVAYSLTEKWQEFSFMMKEISHINNRTTSLQLSPPTQENQQQYRIANEEQERVEMANANIDILNIYDYDEKDITKLENQITSSVALLTLLAQCLPNFEHRLKKNEKEKLIDALYRLPNKIFWVWASAVEQGKEEILQMIIDTGSNDFRRHKIDEIEAESILQWNSLSLLLDFYYGIAINAYKENTLEFLTDMAKTIIDFTEETHQLQMLTILDRSNNFKQFLNASNKLKESTKKSIVQRALNYVAFHMIVKDTLTPKQTAQLKSKFFPKSNPAIFFIQRRISEKN